MKNVKTTWFFLFQNYGKFWSILLEHFIKHNPLIQIFVYVYIMQLFVYNFYLYLAKDIGDVIWNTSKAKLDEDNYEDIKDVMNKAQDELEIHVHDGLPKKTQSFLINMSRSRATMLCGPSFSGKSTIISVNIISVFFLKLNFNFQHTGWSIWVDFIFGARHFPPSLLWWKNVYILIFGI